MKRRFFLFLALSALLLLTGCINDYPAPAPRSLHNIYSSATEDGQLAIAIDPSGAKHILRAECPSGTNPSCEVTYEMTRVGEIGVLVYLTPAGGYTFRNPDIAVSDSNLAYLIWQNCPADDPTGRSCSTWYTRSDDMQPHVLDLGTHSLSAPILASRGETVYAVHEVTNGFASGSVLRYCRVSDASYICRNASDVPATDDGLRRTDAAAAVTSTGALHLAWLAGTGSNRTAYHNDNQGALDANMSHLRSLETGPFFAPSMAIESDDGNVFIALAANETTADASDWIKLHYCTPAECATTGSSVLINLPVEKKWYIFGAPSIAADNTNLLLGFAATNTDHPTQSEIYLTSYTADAESPSASVALPTDLGDYNHDCEPKVAIVSGWPAVGWHICGMGTVRDDVYFLDIFNGGRVIYASDSNGRGDFDMAANGDYVAGIWNEQRPDGRLETWLAFNANMTYIPLVQK